MYQPTFDLITQYNIPYWYFYPLQCFPTVAKFTINLFFIIFYKSLQIYLHLNIFTDDAIVVQRTGFKWDFLNPHHLVIIIFSKQNSYLLKKSSNSFSFYILTKILFVRIAYRVRKHQSICIPKIVMHWMLDRFYNALKSVLVVGGWNMFYSSWNWDGRFSFWN